MGISAIVDSGATTTRWLFYDKEQNQFTRQDGPGLNFNYIPPDEWKSRIQEHILSPAQIEPWQVEEIFFYCAGCSYPEHLQNVVRTLQEIFPRAKAVAHHDLLGAARALAQNQPSYIVILGTGSNAGYYDGRQMIDRHGGTGYILNDEGSAAHIGKHLLNAWLNNDLPPKLHEAFEDFLKMTRQEVMYKIYQDTRGCAVFLGQIARFAIDRYPNWDFLHSLIENALNQFIHTHLKPLYARINQQQPVHAVGGVVARVSHLWKQCLENAGFQPGAIARDSLYGLAQYHWNKTPAPHQEQP